MKTNKIIADFDDKRKYTPYLENSSLDVKFNTYSECIKWLNENKFWKDKGYKPELGWRLKFGNYDRSWEWLMPIIEKIGKIEMPDDKYQSGERIFVEYIYPRTFGQINKVTGTYMFRFNGHSLFEAPKLIDAAYLAVVEVLTFEITRHKQ